MNESFLYRDRLRANLLRKEWTLEVEMGHLIGWDEELAARCRTEPGEVVPLVSLYYFFMGGELALSLSRHARYLQAPLQFEIALRNVSKKILYPTAEGMEPEERERRDKALPGIQLQLRSGSRLMQFRELGVRTVFFT